MRLSYINNTLLVFLVVAACLVSTQAATKKKKKRSDQIAISPDNYRMCRNYPALQQKGSNKKKLQWLTEATGKNSLMLSTSPQHLAACWVLHADKKRSSKKGDLIQRYALAVLHFATTKSNTTVWDWDMADQYDPRVEPVPASSSSSGKKSKKAPTKLKPHHWMSAKHHECSWYGVGCDWRSRVVDLDLGFLKLDGLLPRELSLLNHLTGMDLHGNDLQGVLPHKILVGLPKLQRLRLYMNGFFGALHREIAGLVSLEELSMFGNYMASTIPTELGSLRNLKKIDMYANNLSGRIPKELGQLKHLEYIDLHDNDLVGSVPREICELPKLKVLITDCLGAKPEVSCDCCTVCCRGLPDMRCVDVATGQEVR